MHKHLVRRGVAVTYATVEYAGYGAQWVVRYTTPGEPYYAQGQYNTVRAAIASVPVVYSVYVTHA
jgi:hypothetical protein